MRHLPRLLTALLLSSLASLHAAEPTTPRVALDATFSQIAQPSGFTPEMPKLSDVCMRLFRLDAKGIAAERIIMVNTGVDLSRFRPVKKNDDVFRVVTCGSLSVQKGTHVLLEAFERAKLPGAELVLIGPVLPQLESLAARYASSRVRFVGHVANAELYQWFSQGDVFVMPSIQEGLAAVQAQAMACGLPLISSASSGGEDLIGPDGAEGFIVKTGDSEALRERLEWCFDHRDECRAMGQAALARAGQALTWSAYGERIAAVAAKLRG